MLRTKCFGYAKTLSFFVSLVWSMVIIVIIISFKCIGGIWYFLLLQKWYGGILCITPQKNILGFIFLLTQPKCHVINFYLSRVLMFRVL